MASIANPLYFFSDSTTTSPSSSNVIRFIDVLDFFFIAHPDSGRKEGDEHKRVMYFHPKSENIDRQTELTGFAEAVVNFTDNFLSHANRPPFHLSGTDEFEYRTVSTQKAEHIYIQIENNKFIMGVALSKQLSFVSDYPLFQPALRNILCDAYKMFRMFFGTFESFKLTEDESKFKDRLDFFFSRYIPLLKVHKMPLLDHLGGVEFLRISGPLYLNVVTLISELQEEFPLIEKIVFFYQSKLLYYSLSRRDLPSLFHYLTQNLLPTVLAPELEPTTTKSTKGRYLRGPVNLTSDDPLLGDECLPIVHLHTSELGGSVDIGIGEEEEELLQKYQMMVYRCLNATICMFVRCIEHTEKQSRQSSVSSNEEKPAQTNGVQKRIVSRRMLKNIDSFLETELSIVANKIGDEISSELEQTSMPTDFHYIYFNPASLSMTSSLSSLANQSNVYQTVNSLPKIAMPPMDVNRLVCDTMSNFVSDSEEFGECFVKSDTDWWIVVKKVNSRLLVLLLPPSAHTSSLADVQSKTQVIVQSHFQAIFLS
ncbi:unnamed protein product [Caenorhabditis bovis]|uniref:CCZ1/INTU/HSP4 first Longin domain-containing protein n=1 Tax=Caenorhabditis bovis TaxID=2654633 RepID=A0A8S1ED64_9PELO|nr:unnamed protein product [Caenorhabditis bovis]